MTVLDDSFARQKATARLTNFVNLGAEPERSMGSHFLRSLQITKLPEIAPHFIPKLELKCPLHDSIATPPSQVPHRVQTIRFANCRKQAWLLKNSIFRKIRQIRAIENKCETVTPVESDRRVVDASSIICSILCRHFPAESQWFFTRPSFRIL